VGLIDPPGADDVKLRGARKFSRVFKKHTWNVIYRLTYKNIRAAQTRNDEIRKLLKV